MRFGDLDGLDICVYFCEYRSSYIAIFRLSPPPNYTHRRFRTHLHTLSPFPFIPPPVSPLPLHKKTTILRIRERKKLVQIIEFPKIVKRSVDRQRTTVSGKRQETDSEATMFYSEVSMGLFENMMFVQCLGGTDGKKGVFSGC